MQFHVGAAQNGFYLWFFAAGNQRLEQGTRLPDAVNMFVSVHGVLSTVQGAAQFLGPLVDDAFGLQFETRQ